VREQVLKWLDANALGQYKEMFVVNQIDEQELLKLTDKDLQEMGMIRHVSGFKQTFLHVLRPAFTALVFLESVEHLTYLLIIYSSKAHRRGLLDQIRYLNGAINDSKVKKKSQAHPCVWIGSNVGTVGKINKILSGISSNVYMHGFLTYQVDGSLDGWRRGYAIIQGATLHIFKSALHVVVCHCPLDVLPCVQFTSM
jgi:hypothetical protein